MEGKFERRDITHEYTDCGSQTYAPLTRIGVFIDRNSEQYVVKSRFLSTYQGETLWVLTLGHNFLPYFTKQISNYHIRYPSKLENILNHFQKYAHLSNSHLLFS